MLQLVIVEKIYRDKIDVLGTLMSDTCKIIMMMMTTTIIIRLRRVRAHRMSKPARSLKIISEFVYRVAHTCVICGNIVRTYDVHFFLSI